MPDACHGFHWVSIGFPLGFHWVSRESPTFFWEIHGNPHKKPWNREPEPEFNFALNIAQKFSMKESEHGKARQKQGIFAQQPTCQLLQDGPGLSEREQQDDGKHVLPREKGMVRNLKKRQKGLALKLSVSY